ncbi:PKD-like family lipoprotein [Chitinophaga horti]|uniref:PKD-like family lipoprotein n=1 Tax=Chitinophaga horti TaxID=2920382 RepID=A0ABY6J7Z1_9BACT|nr:PKD-like family lipoprotein [Chitinophaga horti]UYQ95796.1 PKD-like family lipoprotein [Chitinophaga horti]
MKLRQYAFLLLCALPFAACLKDKGNNDIKELNTFYVDTAGLQTSFEARQSLANLKVEPKVVYSGDTANLTYLWRLYATTSTYDTLSNARNLDAPVSLKSGTYPLELIVTEKTTGLRAFMQYSVQVLAAIPSGWMVAYEKDGNTDVDLIRATDFIANLVKDTMINQAYSRSNEGPMPGTPLNITYLSTSASYLFTTKDAGGLQNTDFRKVMTYPQLFVGETDPPYQFTSFHTGTYSQGMYINGKHAYWGSGGVMLGKLLTPDNTDNYEAAPFMVFMYARNGLFYDQQGMRFLFANQWSGTSSAFTNANAGARFNLNNMGKKLLHLERGFMQGLNNDPYKYAFFKDVSGNGRYLYVFNSQAPATPDVAALDISNVPDILDAKFYAISNKGPAIFYTTASKVYSFTYDYITNTYATPVAGFTAPAGEVITACTMFKSHLGNSAQTVYDSKLLFVATWNEATKTGKVHLFAINEVSGAVTPQPLKTWNVGGKVGSMGYKNA